MDVTANDLEELGLLSCDPDAALVARYDTNGIPGIQKDEVIVAINEYLFGTGDDTPAPTKEDVIKLINLYSFGPPSTITVDRTIQLSDYDTNRNESITVTGKGFQNSTRVYIVLDNGKFKADLLSVEVGSDDTFEAVFPVLVPPFVPGKGNMIYAQDRNEPPNVSNRLDFEVEGLLTVYSMSAAVGDVVDFFLVDWPDGPIPAGAVTIAGVTQRIIGSPSVAGSRAGFGIEISPDTPSGTNEIRVTANGESDVKTITISHDGGRNEHSHDADGYWR